MSLDGGYEALSGLLETGQTTDLRELIFVLAVVQRQTMSAIQVILSDIKVEPE